MKFQWEVSWKSEDLLMMEKKGNHVEHLMIPLISMMDTQEVMYTMWVFRDVLVMDAEEGMHNNIWIFEIQDSFIHGHPKHIQLHMQIQETDDLADDENDQWYFKHFLWLDIYIYDIYIYIYIYIHSPHKGPVTWKASPCLQMIKCTQRFSWLPRCLVIL